MALNKEFGVPDMTHVFGCTDAQRGRAAVPAFTPQLVIAEPLLFKMVGAKFIAVPIVPLPPLKPTKLSVGSAAATEILTTASDELPTELVTLSV